MAGRSTVIVTGGAGFIGSELVRQLAARGERVVIIDNLVNGKRENVADVLSRDVTLHVSDVRDSDAVVPHLREARIVFHLACLGVRHSVHSPHENHDVNATATLTLLAAARHADVPRFVYVSSSEVYGGVESTPIHGDAISEDHPAFPCTVYGGSKLAGESYTRAYFRTYGYPTVVIRPFNTYGPRSHHEGDSGEVIPKFLLRCLAGRPMTVRTASFQNGAMRHVCGRARLFGRTQRRQGMINTLGEARWYPCRGCRRAYPEQADGLYVS